MSLFTDALPLVSIPLKLLRETRALSYLLFRQLTGFPE
jgi:hypothetical protein